MEAIVIRNNTAFIIKNIALNDHMRTADELYSVGLLEKTTYDEFRREPDPMKIARTITSTIDEKVKLNSENFAKFIGCLRSLDNKDLESLGTKLEQCLSKLISILIVFSSIAECRPGRV